MVINDIKTPEDILEFMKENIKYGWLDVNNQEYINTIKEFRRIYRASSLEEILSHGIGPCIEQVYLMHCFIIFERDNKVYQIEHPNWERIGIYSYSDEKSAIEEINAYYVNMLGGSGRPVTEFFEVRPGEFNLYINSLDNTNTKNK